VSNCIQLSFVDGPKVEVTGDVPSSYRVQFIDDDTGIQHYEARIATNNWCAANLRYFVNWRIKVEEMARRSSNTSFAQSGREYSFNWAANHWATR